MEQLLAQALAILDSLREWSEVSVIVRLVVAMICGGLIGIERASKRRAAGFRTYMVVCLGATLAMLLNQYIDSMLVNVWQITQTTDAARLGAQVINGIGFLGAGTIIFTGSQQVKGLTTAAGLWASACMGLAIGAGFYEAALIACLMIVLVITLFGHVEAFKQALEEVHSVPVQYHQRSYFLLLIHLHIPVQNPVHNSVLLSAVLHPYP